MVPLRNQVRMLEKSSGTKCPIPRVSITNSTVNKITKYNSSETLNLTPSPPPPPNQVLPEAIPFFRQELLRIVDGFFILHIMQPNKIVNGFARNVAVLWIFDLVSEQSLLKRSKYRNFAWINCYMKLSQVEQQFKMTKFQKTKRMVQHHLLYQPEIIVFLTVLQPRYQLLLRLAGKFQNNDKFECEIDDFVIHALFYANHSKMKEFLANKSRKFSKNHKKFTKAPYKISANP